MDNEEIFYWLSFLVVSGVKKENIIKIFNNVFTDEEIRNEAISLLILSLRDIMIDKNLLPEIIMMEARNENKH